MVKAEAGNEIQNLLVHGTPNSPELFVLPPKHIETATSLAAVPPVFDAIPKRRKTYAIFETDVMWATQAKGKEQPAIPDREQVPELNKEKKPSIDLVIVNFSDPSDFLGNARMFRRANQRIEQYEKLMGFIAGLDSQAQQGTTPTYLISYEKDGNAKNDLHPATPNTIDKLKHVAASFYADELVKDNLTRELAKAVRGRIMLQEDAVVREAEQIIFEFQKPKFTEIEVTKTEIDSSSGTKSTGDKEKSADKPKGEENKPPASEEQKRERDKAGASGKAYDPSMDKPGPDTAAFFEELWNRPF